MKPHVHVGVPMFITVACMSIIFTVAWRAASAKLADKPIGEAMTAVYS